MGGGHGYGDEADGDMMLLTGQLLGYTAGKGGQHWWGDITDRGAQLMAETL